MAVPRGPSPDDQHVHRLSGVAFDPVFIIADHRSGTTLLYQLLAETGAFNVVTAYDVICYGEIVDNHLAGRTAAARQALAERFRGMGLADRGIDGVAVTPDLPEEYGFIIDYSGRPQLSPRTLDRFVEVCRKIRFVGENRPVLLKSPWDALTFAYIKATFPRARFVFVHRHPMHVMTSQLSAVRTLFRERNEYVALLSPWYRDFFSRRIPLAVTRALNSPRFGIGAATVGRHVLKVTGYYASHVGELPGSDYVEIRYEDLCADADATIERILRFVNRPAAGPLQLAARIRPRGVRVPDEVRARFMRIRDRLAPYCARHGYSLDPD